MTTDLKNRWWLDATLITTGTLRVASGEVLENDARVRPEPGADWPRVAAHAGDQGGKPWLPGAGLRGALRAWLEARLPGNDSIRDLFGPPAGQAETAPAGQLAVFGARYLDSRDVAAAVKDSRYWDEGRATVVEPGVAIDRVFGSAAEKKLYFHEVVPAGCRFKLELSVNGADTAAIALLLAALQALGQGEIALGADSQNGRGRLKLEGEWRLRLADPAAQQAWLQARLTGGSNQPLTDFARIHALTAAPLAPATPPARLAIRLDFDSLFLVHDPGRVVAEDGQDVIKRRKPRVDGNGLPLLPASSFRGVLRSHCERIGRTLGEDIHGEGEGLKPLMNIHSLRQLAELDPVSLMFGVTGWRSLLQIDDFVCKSELKPEPLEFVAIDRFTGSVSGVKKFSAEAFRSPTLHGSIQLNNQPIASVLTQLSEKENQKLAATWEKSKNILARALRDLQEGDLHFGSGSAKGFGHCRASFGYEIQAWLGISKEAMAVLSKSPGNAVPIIWPKDIPATEYKSAVAHSNTEDFHNPYQFIPLAKEDPLMRWPSAERSKLIQAPTKRHAKYGGFGGENPRFSGRIICRITAEAPIIIGAAQTAPDNDFRDVSPADANGKPYLPASSLRGMLSAILEVATASAMKILADLPLSISQRDSASGKFSRISKGSVYDYLRNANLSKFLPYGPERNILSPAEMMFGVVGEQKVENNLSALASRVFVSEGHSSNAKFTQSATTLKILASPKPPCPSFYFRKWTGENSYGFISKHDLSAKLHTIRGRKQYLHAQDNQLFAKEWQAPDIELAQLKPNRREQYARVRPILHDPNDPAQFVFHLDFFNLDLNELEALCYILRPTSEFRHKIGMGKPLGLGRIRIDPIGLLLIDRRRRYREVLDDPRYHEVWWADKNTVASLLDERYQQDIKSTAIQSSPSPLALAANFRSQRRSERPDLDALELIGNPKAVVAPVHYPRTLNQTSHEGEQFKWFMANEKGGRPPSKQALGEPTGQCLPILKKNKG